ncbi:MAG: N-acetylmuramoyl-L-alanine amidase [Planctomycetes bacterium]|nr:N-acetylmuramoyl-L-alanine amidase [Planctomycetota bacterium]
MRGAWIVICLTACQGQLQLRAPGPTVDDEIAADLERYVKALKSKNAAVCLDAVDYLPYFGRAAVPGLIAALGSSDPNARGWAAAALGRIPDVRAVVPLIALVDDRAPLQVFVLSDDGEERHSAYDNEAYSVGQQAQIALVAISGQRFQHKSEWEKWWAGNAATFVAPEPEPFLEPMPLPPQARWLKGLKICVDPGHGGDMHKRGYKRGPTSMSEAEVNLRVARFLRDFLQQAGVTVVMTRGSDREVDLKIRAQMAAGCDLFLSVHHNWSPRLQAQATTTWYHESQDHKPASVDLARYVQEETIRQVEPGEFPRGGGLMADTLMYNTGFAVLRHLPADVPGCLVETTYYSNLAMERKLRDIAFNRREAYGMFLGIVRYVYYGIPRAEIAEVNADVLRAQTYDGLEDRREWASAHRVLSEYVRVKIDGAVVPCQYDPATGRIEVKGPFGSGEHEAVVELINVHKNHSWPKPLKFTVR